MDEIKIVRDADIAYDNLMDPQLRPAAPAAGTRERELWDRRIKQRARRGSNPRVRLDIS